MTTSDSTSTSPDMPGFAGGVRVERFDESAALAAGWSPPGPKGNPAYRGVGAAIAEPSWGGAASRDNEVRTEDDRGLYSLLDGTNTELDIILSQLDSMASILHHRLVVDSARSDGTVPATRPTLKMVAEGNARMAFTIRARIKEICEVLGS